MGEKLSTIFPTEHQQMTVETLRQETNEKIEKMNNLMYVLVVAVIIGFLAMIVTLSLSVLDQMRFNNATYRQFNTSNELREEKISAPMYYGTP